METITNQTQETKQFVAPTKPEDFIVKKIVKKTIQSQVEGEADTEVEEEVEESVTKIEHTYDNGNKVVFLLLTNGKIARVREGSGEEVEKAQIECGENKEQYLVSMMASTVSIDGKSYNMHELPKALKMKDYLLVKTEFANLNF